jgi:ubiquinone/menaquinone biosynthesis C-methylase UbiE
MSVYYRGKRAQSYDQRYQHFTACTLSATLALLNVEAIAEQAQKDRRVPRLLDVACGTGVLLSLLHERFPTAELTGIDSSQDMLAQAQARLCGIAHLRLAQVVIGPDAQAGLPYPSDSFDLITCTNALNAMPNPVATLADLHRLLVPGGHLLLEDIAWRLPHFLWGLSTWLARRVGAGSLHPSTQAEARSLCEQAGFSIRASHAFVTDWLWHGWVIHSVKNEGGGRS